MKDSKGRKVVDIETERNRDGSAYVVSAVYDDDLSDVPEDELDGLTDRLWEREVRA